MNNLFNTEFEFSLRVLLILEAAREQMLTEDMLAATDFISVYGKEFGMADKNLHGDNKYKFSEFTLRRELVLKGIKYLVLNDLIHVTPSTKGFSYSINQNGLRYISNFASDYAESYRRVLKQTLMFIVNKTERDMLNFINHRSLSSLREEEIDV